MTDESCGHEIKHLFGVVALVGPPNAGKSTLMNSLVGEKVAIVTPKAQTTRNRISGILSTECYQVVFMDTPGIHKTRGKLGEHMNRSAMESLHSADLVLVVADMDLYVRKPHFLKKDFQELRNRLSAIPRVLIAANKIDKIRDKKIMLPVWSELGHLFPDRDIFPVSAATKEGTSELLEKILGHLSPGPPLYPADQLSTLPMRFMASEIIREKLFLALRQEVPYGLAVEIEYWNEEVNMVRLGVLVYVLRDAHKAMVIGHRGSMLKKVCTLARQEIEIMTGKKVFMETFVKVRPGWNESPGFLRSLGI